MYGPYIAKENGEIKYVGNKIFKPIENIKNIKITKEVVENRVNQFIEQKEYWKAIIIINNTIYKKSVEYFESLGAKFILLPLTTRMISSPGAVYGKKKINYTQDTVPIKLKWFNVGTVFLSESSQLYLELSLIINDIDHVYSIYNSFRKEKADYTHLSEFHHIEYEGHVSQEENEKIAKNLTKYLIDNLLTINQDDLKIFLTNEDLNELEKFTKNDGYKKITLKKALEILYQETGDKKYEKFTSMYWGFWEEVFITNYFDSIVLVREFPMLEVAFYHKPLKKEYDPVSGEEIWVVDNADFIFSGYREYIGSGHRIETIEELEWKAKLFNLPKEDYQPYYVVRASPTYKPSSGFGMGWERFMQGILKMPTIIDVCLFPRVHFTIKP